MKYLYPLNEIKKLWLFGEHFCLIEVTTKDVI